MSCTREEGAGQSSSTLLIGLLQHAEVGHCERWHSHVRRCSTCSSELTESLHSPRCSASGLIQIGMLTAERSGLSRSNTSGRARSSSAERPPLLMLMSLLLKMLLLLLRVEVRERRERAREAGEACGIVASLRRKGAGGRLLL